MILSCHKKLSALFRRIKLKHDNDFYCLNCFLFIFVKAKTSIAWKGWYTVIVFNESGSILKYSRGKNSIKAPFIIYADTESFLQKCMLTKIIQSICPREK